MADIAIIGQVYYYMIFIFKNNNLFIMMYILKIYFMKNMYFLLESYLGLPANLK